MKPMLQRLFLLPLFAMVVMFAVPFGGAVGAERCRGNYSSNWSYCVGTLKFKDGGKYVGEFRNGKFHGQGYSISYNGKYVGEWRNSKRHGHGIFTYTAPSKYNPKVFARGSTYVGEYRFGDIDGQGTATNADGDKFVGQFRAWKFHGRGKLTRANGTVEEGIWENGILVSAKQTQRRKSAKGSSPPPKSDPTGSGFFVSRLGHVVTNQHVVDKCNSVTVGDNANKQVGARVLETDQRNDLALLRISSMEMASAQTKTLVAKLGLTVTPLASQGLLRPDAVELGEDVVVAGFPFGDMFSNTIKITKGVVSAKRGIGDDTGKFQLDAAVQPGNSGGPIYDENGSIIGVVVSQLNKLKLAKAIGSIPENVNFGIKASTVKQFLNASGLPSSWSKRTKRMSTKDIAKIAENQTVMVVCHR